MDDAAAEVAHLALHRRLPPQQHRQDRHHHDHRPAHREQEPGLHSRAEPLHSTSIRTRVNPCFIHPAAAAHAHRRGGNPKCRKPMQRPCACGSLAACSRTSRSRSRTAGSRSARTISTARGGFGAQQLAEVAPECRWHPSLVVPVHAAHRPCLDHALVHERGDVQLLRANTYPTLSRPGTSHTPARICGASPAAAASSPAPGRRWSTLCSAAPGDARAAPGAAGSDCRGARRTPSGTGARHCARSAAAAVRHCAGPAPLPCPTFP